MRKQNVFVVSGRMCDACGYPISEVKNYVVCAVNNQKVHAVIETAFPNFSVLSVTSLVTLEESVKKIKASLAGTDNHWPVLLEPQLIGARAHERS